MSLFNVFEISGQAMSAQSIRLNTTASNIANADSVSSSAGETYRARHPVFAAEMQKAIGVTADGDFGFGTLTAVKKWQKMNGLTADGIVGPATQAKMFS